MKTSFKKLAQHFPVLSEILEGCFNLFISQRLFDSGIKNRSMVITEDLLAFFKNCLPLEFSCTWIYSVLLSVAILLAAAEREKQLLLHNE